MIELILIFCNSEEKFGDFAAQTKIVPCKKDVNTVFRATHEFVYSVPVSKVDFEEFGKRIGLPEKIVECEIDSFTKEIPLVKELIDRSFLSDSLKQQY
ncbi:hypothetical protein [Bacteroides sp.]